jgi:hypothetical protein
VIISVRNMARPARPISEAKTVRAALKGSNLSNRAAAAQLARAVAREAMRYCESNDPFEDALIMARIAISPDPVTILASCPEIDIAQIIRNERVKRYEARECRQLAPLDWDAETQQITRKLEKTLASRFRKIL